MSWQVDQSHSSIEFSVRHMMISKVRGRFENFEAVVNFDDRYPNKSTVEVTVDVASINTRDSQRDGHLKSADFFDAATYPNMTFRSSRVEQLDKGHARLFGNLTIKDISRPVTLEVEYLGRAVNPFSGQTSFGFNASGKINRKAWDMTWNQALETGGILVGDEIAIHIELELIKVGEAIPAEPVLA